MNPHWTVDDAKEAWKQGWQMSGVNTPIRRRGFNRWGNYPEFLRWLQRRAEAGDPLCSKAVALKVAEELTR